MIHNMNDGLKTKPYLRTDISIFTLTDLPDNSKGLSFNFFGNSQDKYQKLKKDGFDGIQSFSLLKPSPRKCKSAGLGRTAADIVSPFNIMKKAKKWKKKGYECATILIGNGCEGFEEGCIIAEKVLKASLVNNFPIYIELHRGTVTQNIPLTLKLIEKYPDLRFNADFSHYVTGYGWDRYFDEDILNRIQPILERVCFIHGRISDSRGVQIHHRCDFTIESLFRLLWTRSFESFLGSAKPGDFCCFAPELLPKITDYSQVNADLKGFKEAGDRYLEALRLAKIARECFTNALSGVEDEMSGYYKTEKMVKKEGDTTLFHALDISDLNELKLNRCKFSSKWIRVRLGNGLEDSLTRESLIREFVSLQSLDKSIVLETSRGSVIDSIPQTLEYLKKYPELELSFNMSEWIINHEIRTDRLFNFYLLLCPVFKNIKLIVEKISTAQRTGVEPLYLDTRLPPFDVTCMNNWTYRKFFMFIWKRIKKVQPSSSVVTI